MCHTLLFVGGSILFYCPIIADEPTAVFMGVDMFRRLEKRSVPGAIATSAKKQL